MTKNQYSNTRNTSFYDPNEFPLYSPTRKLSIACIIRVI